MDTDAPTKDGAVDTTPVPEIELVGITDSAGSPLATGERVRVTGSSRFGTIDGSVIGYMRQLTEDKRLDEHGDLVAMLSEQSVRIRVRLDGHEEDEDYSASQGRVTKIDTENAGGDELVDAEVVDSDASAA